MISKAVYCAAILGQISSKRKFWRRNHLRNKPFPVSLRDDCCRSGTEPRIASRVVHQIAILQTLSILKFAVSTAISSPDYQQQSARKKRITSRANSGCSRLSGFTLLIGGYS
jgi:hypothetical protein